MLKKTKLFHKVLIKTIMLSFAVSMMGVMTTKATMLNKLEEVKEENEEKDEGKEKDEENEDKDEENDEEQKKIEQYMNLGERFYNENLFKEKEIINDDGGDGELEETVRKEDWDYFRLMYVCLKSEVGKSCGKGGGGGLDLEDYYKFYNKIKLKHKLMNKKQDLKYLNRELLNLCFLCLKLEDKQSYDVYVEEVNNCIGMLENSLKEAEQIESMYEENLKVYKFLKISYGFHLANKNKIKEQKNKFILDCEKISNTLKELEKQLEKMKKERGSEEKQQM